MIPCSRLRSSLLCFVLLLLAAPLAAQETFINIRMVNLIPDAPAINFHLNSSSTEPLKLPVPFRGASDPVIMQSLGTANVFFTNATNNAEIYSTSVNLANNTRRNIVLLSTMGSIQSRILSLTIPPPTESPEADFRFMNASPDGGAVDLTITEADGSTQTVSSLAFGENTEFLSLAAGMTRLEVFAAGTQNKLLNVQGIVRAGFFYTGFVTGMASDLDFRVMIESDHRAQVPMTRWTTPPPPNDSELRLVNMTVPDQAVDIYMDGVRKVSEVTYRSTSAISGIPSGAHTFAFVRAGEAIGEAFHTETITLAAKTSLSAVVMGTPPSPVTVRMLTRSMEEVIAAGRTKARVVLANAIGGPVDVVLRDSSGAELRVANAQPGVLSDFMTLYSGPAMLELSQPGQPPAARYLGFLPSGGVATVFVSGNASDGIVVSVLVETDPAIRAPLMAFTPSGNGALRFVHVSSGTPDAAFSLGGSQPAAQTLSFLDAGAGLDLFSGLLPLDVRVGGAPLVAGNITVGRDSLTTVLLAGDIDAPELVELRTSESDIEPAPGKAHVRGFIAAELIMPLRVEIVYSGGAKRTFDSLEFKDVTPYFEITGGPITVNVYAQGTAEPLVRLGGTIAAGRTVTVIAAGVDTEGRPLVAVLDDGEQAAQEPMQLLEVITSSAPLEALHRSTLSVVPNPARELARVAFAPTMAGDARVMLYDMTGRRRAEITIGGDAVSTRVATIATGELESGPYNVVVVESDGAASAAGVLHVAR